MSARPAVSPAIAALVIIPAASLVAAVCLAAGANVEAAEQRAHDARAAYVDAYELKEQAVTDAAMWACRAAHYYAEPIAERTPSAFNQAMLDCAEQQQAWGEAGFISTWSLDRVPDINPETSDITPDGQ